MIAFVHINESEPNTLKESIWEYIEHGPPASASPEEATPELRARLIGGSLVAESLRRKQTAENLIVSLKHELADILEKFANTTHEKRIIDDALGLADKLPETPPQPYIQAAERFQQLVTLKPDDLLDELKHEPPFYLHIMSRLIATGGGKSLGVSWPEQNTELLDLLFDSYDRKSFSRAANCLSRSVDHVPYLEERGILSHTRIHSYGLDDSRQFVGSTRIERPHEFFEYAVDNIHNFGRISVAATVTMAELQRLDWE